MMRNDPHRPSVISPEDYEILDGPGAFHYYWNSWSTCAHCGHALKYAVRFVYKGEETIDIGQDCAMALDTTDRVEYEMVRLRKSVAAERMKIAREKENEARRAEMLENDPDVVEYLDFVNPSTEKFTFIVSMVEAMDKYGSLTPRQVEAVRNVMQKREEYAVKKLAEIEPTTLAPEGRVQVEGEVLKTKWHYSEYYGDTLKMTVKLDDNNKVWGSVPESIHNVEKGQRVRFTGTFTLSDDDEHFSTFKRPAKAEIL
jgi:hypothetical protein